MTNDRYEQLDDTIIDIKGSNTYLEIREDLLLFREERKIMFPDLFEYGIIALDDEITSDFRENKNEYKAIGIEWYVEKEKQKVAEKNPRTGKVRFITKNVPVAYYFVDRYNRVVERIRSYRKELKNIPTSCNNCDIELTLNKEMDRYYFECHLCQDTKYNIRKETALYHKSDLEQ